MNASSKKAFLFKYAKAYVSVFAMVFVVVGISEWEGAGWRPALAGLPLYLTFFVLVTYSAVKDRRALTGKPWLTRQKLWMRFKIACAVMFFLYVIEVIWWRNKGNGLQDVWMAFPLFLGGVFVASLLLYGEIKELNKKEGGTDD